MCTVQVPQGGNPIAVNKYINTNTNSPSFSLLTMTTSSFTVKTTLSFSRHHSENPKDISLHKTSTSVRTTVQTRTANNLTSAQPPSRLKCSCLRSRESWAKQIFWGGGGWYSSDDGQISPLTMTEGICCVIWKPLRLLLFTACTCVYNLSTTPDFKFYKP
jgi:hypothetical protein